MKILWFSNTSSNYGVDNIYNGGGWISSLETELTNKDGISLGICFWHNSPQPKLTKNNVCYYPLYNRYASFGGKIRKLFMPSNKIAEQNIAQYLQVIEDFQPDVITVFGTEQDFGLVTPYIKIPVVVYIQGVLCSCVNAFLPPGQSLIPYVFADFNPIKIKKRYRDYQIICQNAERELRIFRGNKYFIGRTGWDKSVVRALSKHSRYYHCDEILRSDFYTCSKRTVPEQLVITSTLSSPLYKGVDMVFKTAKVLHELFEIPFIWNVYGNVDARAAEKHMGYKVDGIAFKGVASSSQLKDALLNSTVYVHTSYIENSPNSLCEAQILGCPVVGQNVGGISTLVQNGHNGYLVPANDPILMASSIYDLYVDKELNNQIGENARSDAQNRHNKEKIVAGFFDLYSQLTGQVD